MAVKKTKKIDKDTIMNTPKEMKDGVKLMPYDEDSLRTFSLKKMNFSEMTGYQKTTFVVIIIFILCLILIMSASSIRSLFTGVQAGKIRFFWNGEEEPKEETTTIVSSSNFISIGQNFAIELEPFKFYGFSKSKNDTIIYNYVSKEDKENIKSLNIYIEVFNNTKSLLSRHRFTVDNDSVKKDVVGLNQIKLTSNNYNKAYYIKVRVLTEAEISVLPDYNDPGTSGGNGSGNDPSNPSGGGSDDPTPIGPLDSLPLNCNIISSDEDLKITKSINAIFVDGIIESYSVDFRLTSSGVEKSSKFETNYNKMLKLFKNVLASPGCSGDLSYEALDAKLKYNVVLKDYKDLEFDPNQTYDEEYLKEFKKKYQTPYRLEIEKGSTREEAMAHLQESEWICD